MNNYKNKYESLVSSIKIKDITSNEENARILQSLRNNDSTYERMCLFSHHEDSGDFVLGDDMDEIAWFGYFLGNNTKIEDFEIKLPEQIIRDQGFEVSEEAISNITKLFCGGLNRNRSIKKLTFYGDLGNGDIFTWLMPFFQNNDNLTDVVVDDGDDEPTKLKCCRKIALALRSTKLRHLNLSYNGMQFSGAEILARALTSNKSLHTLDLHENSIGDAGVDSFTRALANMHTLRVLDLGGNSIGLSGCKSLASLLENKSSGLEELLLTSCNINDQGACCFAKALMENRSLKKLGLDNNEITTSGWSAFSKVLCDTSSVNKTFLSNHTLGYFKRQEHYGPGRLPGNVREPLQLNGKDDDQSKIAATKILKYHSYFVTKPFFDWEFKALPLIIGWTEKARSCVDNAYHPQIGKMRLSSIYDFVRAMPMMYIELHNRQKLDEIRAIKMRVQWEQMELAARFEDIERQEASIMEKLAGH